MTTEEFYGYFEDLTSRNKKILHDADTRPAFFRSIDEFLEAQGNNKVHYPAVVMDNIEGRLAGGTVDGAVDEVDTGILFVEQVKKQNDFALQAQAHDHMKALAMAFIKRMNRDVELCEPRASKILQGFNPLTVKYKLYGPFFDNCFGVHIGFKPQQVINLDYEADDWME